MFEEGDENEKGSDKNKKKKNQKKDEEPFYHINTLPFETLYELY